MQTSSYMINNLINHLKKLETVQYNASLVITDALRRTSQERLYYELGLDSLCVRRWSFKLLFYQKTVKAFSLLYQHEILSCHNVQYY